MPRERSTRERSRPRTLKPRDIGFVPQRAVPWLNPGLLAGTATRVVLAHLLGGYLDKRELQGVLPSVVHDYSEDDEIWLDYTADIGDGFDAAYSVAHVLAQSHVEVGDETVLPRPRLLVLGGDEVYPVAAAVEYENRWKGPYRAALPDQAEDAPTIFALPGNHDWYDGLTSFLRVFAQGDDIGGWRTEQARSYFAIKLPHRWWLWAVDTQLDAYFDEPQLDYFAGVAKSIGPGDHIILCIARPAWVLGDDESSAYDTIDFFVRQIIDPSGATIAVMVAGDRHHYARYEAVSTEAELDSGGSFASGAQLITSGGGGAYLVGTAHLPDEVTVPSPESTDPVRSEPRNFTLSAAFPSPRKSSRLAWSVFARLPWRNPGFVGMLGLFQTLLMLALLTADGRWAIDDWTVNAPIGFAIVAVFTGTVMFATLVGRGGLKHWIAGFLHGIPHVALGAVGMAIWDELPFVDLPNPLPLLTALVLYLPVIGLIDTWVLSLYLLAARPLGINSNELYAGLGVKDHKNFLRLHIDGDGTLTIYAIGIEKISRSWRANPDGPPGSSWIEPVGPIRPHLIEPPLTFPPPR